MKCRHGTTDPILTTKNSIQRDKSSLPYIYLGAPMWSHRHWKSSFFTAQTAQKDHLAEYARFYSSVEGNTTFYAVPTEDKIIQWCNSVPKSFKFCFKVPKRISHELGLEMGFDAMVEFVSVLSVMKQADKLGQIMLQLPPHFSANGLEQLNQFLEVFAPQLPLAVEVRHPDFFAKGAAERQFNRLLMHHQVNRVMMDTRAIHAENPLLTPENRVAILEAQAKKPQVPVHVLATGKHPIIRYVGQMNLLANKAFIQPWLKPFEVWLNEGKIPYLFIHTADNRGIHDLTELWLTMLTEALGYRPYPNVKRPVVLQGKDMLADTQTCLF